MSLFDILQDDEAFNQHCLRGLKLHKMPCGTLTNIKHRKRHNWIVIDKDTGEIEEYGEDYAKATKRGLEINAYLTLELEEQKQVEEPTPFKMIFDTPEYKKAEEYLFKKEQAYLRGAVMDNAMLLYYLIRWGEALGRHLKWGIYCNDALISTRVGLSKQEAISMAEGWNRVVSKMCYVAREIR